MATKYDRNSGRWECYNVFCRQSMRHLSGKATKAWIILFSGGSPTTKDPRASTVTIGLRLLGDYMGCCTKTAQRAIEELEGAGLVVKLEDTPGKRSLYWLRGTTEKTD